MFSSPVRLEVRSPVDDLIDALPEELRKRGELLLGDRRLALDGLRLEEKLRLPGEACVFLRSPVTAHQTLPGGKTRFFSPEEPEWQDRLGDNLRAKLSALGMEPAPAFSITALDTVPKKQVIRFKETYIPVTLGASASKPAPKRWPSCIIGASATGTARASASSILLMKRGSFRAALDRGRLFRYPTARLRAFRQGLSAAKDTFRCAV